MRRFFQALMALVLLSSPAFAAEKPPEFAKIIHADAPYSQATYSLVFISIYNAELWTDATPWSFNKPFGLSLVYQLDASRKKIVDRSIDEMNNNTDSGPLDEATTTKYRALLNKLIPNVGDGERLSAVYIPGKSIEFFHDGKSTGIANDPKFAHDFMGIWLSKGTTDTSFRAKLLKSAE